MDGLPRESVAAQRKLAQEPLYERVKGNYAILQLAAVTCASFKLRATLPG
jgi:hypothetical protein